MKKAPPKINLSKNFTMATVLLRTRFSKKLMVIVVVCWSGKKWYLFHWSTENKRWPELLKTFLLLECCRLYPGNDFELLQDSAPSHRTKVTQQFLRPNTTDLITADEWASWGRDSALFPLIDWISISYSEMCWTYWLFCTFRTPNTLLRTSLLKQ